MVLFLPHMPFRGFLSGVSCPRCDDKKGKLIILGFVSPEPTLGPSLSLMLAVEKVWSSRAHIDPLVSLCCLACSDESLWVTMEICFPGCLHRTQHSGTSPLLGHMIPKTTKHRARDFAGEKFRSQCYKQRRFPSFLRPGMWSIKHEKKMFN